MDMVGKYCFENSSSIPTHKVFLRAVSLRIVLAFARSAQLNKKKQNRFKLLNKDGIYYLGSNKYLRVEFSLRKEILLYEFFAVPIHDNGCKYNKSGLPL